MFENEQLVFDTRHFHWIGNDKKAPDRANGASGAFEQKVAV